jgi:hypothetical protein
MVSAFSPNKRTFHFNHLLCKYHNGFHFRLSSFSRQSLREILFFLSASSLVAVLHITYANAIGPRRLPNAEELFPKITIVCSQLRCLCNNSCKTGRNMKNMQFLLGFTINFRLEFHREFINKLQSFLLPFLK